MKRLLSFIAAALAVVLLFTGCGLNSCANFADRNVPDGVKSVLGNTVTVTHNDGNGVVAGTAFVVCSDESGTYAVTNYHVVAGSEEVSVRYGEDLSGSCTATLVGWYEYHDLAVISLDISGGADFTTISEDMFIAAEAGEDAYSIGNEYGNGKLVVDYGAAVGADVVTTEKLGWYEGGESEVKHAPVCEYTCSVERGMSGGPITDKDGNITGVGTYRTGDSEHYYGVDARIARAVCRAALSGNFCKGTGSGTERGKETLLFGEGYYRLFLDGAGGGEFMFLGNYHDWNTRRVLHPVGFTASLTSEGMYVRRTGVNCPLTAGDVVTAIDGIPLAGMTQTDIMALMYDGFELTDSTADAAVFTLAGGGETDFAGGGYAVAAR